MAPDPGPWRRSARDAFPPAAGAVRGVLRHRAIETRWAQPSVLAGMSVGALVGHLLTVVDGLRLALERAATDDGAGRTVDAIRYYGRARVAGESELDGPLHRTIRETAEQAARPGAAATLARLEDCLDRTVEALREAPPDLIVPLRLAGGGGTPLDDWVATRIVELAVHGDDLARSLGEPGLEPPPVVADVASAVVVALARQRMGDAAFLRAMTRMDGGGGDLRGF